MKAHQTVNLKKSCLDFSRSIQRSLLELMQVKLETHEKTMSVKSIDESENLFFSVVFTGQVYGEFIIGLNQETALAIFNIKDKKFDQQKNDFIDALCEVINISSAQGLQELKVVYPELSIIPPRALLGQVYLPRYTFEKTTLFSHHGQLTCYVYIDCMKLEITEALEKAHADLKQLSQTVRTA